MLLPRDGTLYPHEAPLSPLFPRSGDLGWSVLSVGLESYFSISSDSTPSAIETHFASAEVGKGFLPTGDVVQSPVGCIQQKLS